MKKKNCSELNFAVRYFITSYICRLCHELLDKTRKTPEEMSNVVKLMRMLTAWQENTRELS